MPLSLKGNYYNGAFHLTPIAGANSADSIIVKSDPSNREATLWQIPINLKDVEQVIQSSLHGFKEWKRTSTQVKEGLLQKVKSSLKKREAEIAHAISLETGRPAWDVLQDISACFEIIDHLSASFVSKISPTDIFLASDRHESVAYLPVGPTLVITPSSDPFALPFGQILSALLAGNSVIFKPSEKSPYSGQLLVELLEEAALPLGVLNLIHGDAEIAKRVIREKAVRAIMFSGKYETGLALQEMTSRSLGKFINISTGGNNFSIVHSDVELKSTIFDHVHAAYMSSGQRSSSTSIIAVHHSIRDQFIEEFHQLSKRLIIDHPFSKEATPFMGPLIDQLAVENYLLFMGMAKREGIEEIMRGKPLERKNSGHFVSPSIHLMEKFSAESRFFQSEILGPNVLFIPYHEISEAIAYINQNDHGMMHSIYTNDEKIQHLCKDEILSSSLLFNIPTVLHNRRIPFVGIKNSGNYRSCGPCNIESNLFLQSSQKSKGPRTLSDIGIKNS